jgi:hypothetical protein
VLRVYGSCRASGQDLRRTATYRQRIEIPEYPGLVQPVWCHLNGYSHPQAELTCGLIDVDIAAPVLELDPRIVLWEDINLNSAYVLARRDQPGR